MDDLDGQIKACLVQMKVISREQVARTESYAAKQNVPFQRALLSLDVVKPADLGRCLSHVHQLPYIPLLARPIPDQLKNILSAQCMTRWKVFPADYDTDQHVLTLAVYNPDQIPQMEHIFQLLMQPYTLAFVIASEIEIEKAVEALLAKPQPAGQSAAPQQTQASKPGEPDKPLKLSALRTAEAKPPAAAQDGRTQTQSASQPAGRERDLQFTREDMGRSLTSAAALLVSVCLETNPDELAGVRERVRYGQLLAARLNMLPLEVDRIAIASWLSGIETRPQIVKQFMTPYHVEKVLFPGDKPSPESLILSLVRCYQDMKKRDPSACKDVNLTRRNLRLAWSCPPEYQGLLELFLQLLMDEEFLESVGHAAGRILIVDPVELSTACMAPPLTNDGYEVHVVPSAETAKEFISSSRPDLIIAEVDLPDATGLKFCQGVKHDSATAKIPFLAIMSLQMERFAAEFLRAGADDFMIKPVNLELLFLKIQKLTVGPHSLSVKTGVRGSLEDMSFTDMIQIVCAGNKNLEILLNGEGQAGHVFIQNGEVIHALVGDKQGEEAFYNLMLWQKGEFNTKQCSQFPARTIKVSTMSLLMEGARLADEGRTQEV